MNRQPHKKLSIVIPVKDEQDSLEVLTKKIAEEIEKLKADYSAEIIYIDDGSTDESWDIICRLAEQHQGVIKGIRFRRNFGKSLALEAGFRHAKGDIIFTMDADLQDDPQEILKFIEALNNGHDMVSGWKKKRHDPLGKTIPSRFFNKVTAKLTGVPLHDFNCGFKAYKREVVESIHLYGELHRYIPVLAHDYGFKVGEIEVQHHSREHGVSKYGFERYARGLLDLITVLSTTRWLNKPGHLFGGIGILAGMLGSGILLYLFIVWILGYGPIGNRPLLTFGVLLTVTGVQLVSLGIIAEFFIKINNPKIADDYVAEVVEFKIQ